jgi:hypothetical protein
MMDDNGFVVGSSPPIMVNPSPSSKKRIKIYQRTYELPDLGDPQFDEVRHKIKSRQQLIKAGTREVSRGLFGLGRHVEELGFEERFQQLELLVKDYEYYINLLKTNQGLYQNFFVQLSNEIKNIITKQCKTILEIDGELQQLAAERIGAAELREDRRELLITLKIVEKGALLMLKKAEVFSAGLQRLAESQDKQQEALTGILGELAKKKRHYAVRLKMAKARQEAEQLAQVAINFDRTLSDLFGPLKQLVDEVIKTDDDLAQSALEIKSIVEDILSDRTSYSRFDQISESILDFQVSSYRQRGELEDALERVQTVGHLQGSSNYYVEDAAVDTVSVADAIALIQSHVDGQLSQMRGELAIAPEPVGKQAKISPSAAPEPVSKPVMSSSPIPSPSSSPAPSLLKKSLLWTTETLAGAVIPVMVDLPTGELWMGSLDSDVMAYNDEKPRHQVSVSAFAIRKYPITQAQYQAIMGKNPSVFRNTPQNPVE